MEFLLEEEYVDFFFSHLLIKAKEKEGKTGAFVSL